MTKDYNYVLTEARLDELTDALENNADKIKAALNNNGDWDGDLETVINALKSIRDGKVRL